MTSIDLYKEEHNKWVVVLSGVEYSSNTIEEAADLLEACGVISDEIDVALISMVTNGQTRANFGVIKGTFIFSDNKNLVEALSND